MRTTVKDVGFALFFLAVIALVAVEAAEDDGESGYRTIANEQVRDDK